MVLKQAIGQGGELGRPLRQLLPLLLLLSAAERSLAIGFFGAPSPSPAGDISCSRTCESEYCSGISEAPLMRYGKYCGFKYTGCPGEAPCDAVDACCMIHDACVEATDDDYFNMLCNQSLLACLAAVKSAAEAEATDGGITISTWDGNQCNATDVAGEITSLLEAAVFAKRIMHKLQFAP